MTSKPKRGDSEKARENLEAVERAGRAARRRGAYPIWAAVLISAWAGLTTGLTLMDYDKTLYVFLVGVAALIFYRQRQGAWILDFEGTGRTRYGAAAVIGLAVIIGGGVLLAKTYALEWAPVPIGILTAFYIFALLVLAHGKTWAGRDGE